MSQKRSKRARQLKAIRRKKEAIQAKFSSAGLRAERIPFWKRYDIEIGIATITILAGLLVFSYFSKHPLQTNLIPTEFQNVLDSVDSQQEADLTKRFAAGYQLFLVSNSNAYAGKLHNFHNDRQLDWPEIKVEKMTLSDIRLKIAVKSRQADQSLNKFFQVDFERSKPRIYNLSLAMDSQLSVELLGDYGNYVVGVIGLQMN